MQHVNPPHNTDRLNTIVHFQPIEHEKNFGRKRRFSSTCLPKQFRISHLESTYSRNVIDVDWELVVKLALPAKVTRRAYKVFGIYDRPH
jgi:hypothetical protein